MPGYDGKAKGMRRRRVRTWTHDSGLECAVYVTKVSGWMEVWMGYVKVPEEHPWLRAIVPFAEGGGTPLVDYVGRPAGEWKSGDWSKEQHGEEGSVWAGWSCPLTLDSEMGEDLAVEITGRIADECAALTP